MDVSTLAQVLAYSLLLQVLVLALHLRMTATIDGQRWWVTGMALLAAGFLVNTLRNETPLGLMAVVANNLLLISGLGALSIGARRLFGASGRHALIATITAVFMVAIVVFTYGYESLGARRAAISVVSSGFAFLVARDLAVLAPPPVRSSACFLAAVFVVSGLFFVARGVTTLFVPPGGFYTRSPVQVATYLVMLGSSLLWTMGFIVLVNQWLSRRGKEAKENLEAIFNASPGGVLVVRLEDDTAIDVNTTFLRMSGYARHEVVGRRTRELGLWKSPEERAQLDERLRLGEHCEDVELVCLRRNGESYTGLVSASLLTLEGATHGLTVVRDISDRHRTEAALQATSRQLELLLESTGEGLYGLDIDGRCTFINRSALEALGYTREECVGQDMHRLVHHSRADGTPYAVEQCPIYRSKHSGVGARVEADVVWRKDGRPLDVEYSAFPIIEDGRTTGAVVSLSDITERKRAEEQLRLLATTDTLTGATNRRQFIELAKMELKRAARRRGPLSLAVVDLDHFKAINDTHGHAAGDRVLSEFADICRQNIRDVDVFARFGGDEFVLLLPEASVDQARTVLERIRRDLRQVAPPVTISAGISVLRAGVSDLDAMLERADKMLYVAKSEGRDRVVGDDVRAIH